MILQNSKIEEEDLLEEMMAIIQKNQKKENQE